MRWKIFMVLVCVLALSAGMAFAAGEEKWPTKPIEVVIGFQPGGSADQSARTYGPIMSKELGVPVVITYKPGALASIAGEYVAKAKPDGYTIMEMNFTQISRRPLTHNVAFNIHSYTPILSHSDQGWCFLVKKDAPWKNWKDFVEYARKNPGVNYGTSGAYNSGHIIAEWIARRDGLKLSFVPFKGLSEVMPAILGGHIDFGASSGGHVDMVEGGKLRTLLQLNGEAADATKVDYLREAYPDFPEQFSALIGLCGLVGPKGIPAPVVQKLANAARKAFESEEFKQYTKKQKYPIMIWDGAQIQKAIEADNEIFGNFLKTIGFKKEG